MKILPLIIIIILVYVIFRGGDTWQGFYYPNGCLSCESDYIFSPIFKEKQQCLDWANNLKNKRNNSSDDFECGLNCKQKDGFNVCKETTDS